MKVTPFPLCCGAFIVSNFGNTQESMGTKDLVPKKDVAAFLNIAKQRYGGSAFIMAILNSDQKRALGRTFEECGFPLLEEGFTHEYGENLSIFMYSNDPDSPNASETEDEGEDDEDYEDFDEDEEDEGADPEPLATVREVLNLGSIQHTSQSW